MSLQRMFAYAELILNKDKEQRNMTLKDFLNQGDRFAANAGAQLVEVHEGYARAEMTVTREHLNAGGVCQGGALFTLADLALAAVMNSHGRLTLSIESTISFLSSAVEGDLLTAEAVETHSHHKIPYLEVKVRNQCGELVCAFTALGYCKDKDLGVG